MTVDAYDERRLGKSCPRRSFTAGEVVPANNFDYQPEYPEDIREPNNPKILIGGQQTEMFERMKNQALL